MKRKPDSGGASSEDPPARVKKPKVREVRRVDSEKNGRGKVGKKPEKKPERKLDKKPEKKPERKLDKKPERKLEKKPERKLEKNTVKNTAKDHEMKTEKNPEKKPEKKPEKRLDRKARKELTETRKKKRKPNYDLEKEIKLAWEKMRQRDIGKSERTKLASEILIKMKGKLQEMAGSHVSSRVLQAAMKHCQEGERKAAFEELRPQALTLARNTYAHHLVIRMLDFANKSQLHTLLSLLHGNIVPLLRHPVGSAVVEHAYQLANASQRREMIREFYSPEYQLFKGLSTDTKGVSELLAKEPLSKQNNILQHMMLGLQPILEKGIVDHSITHRALAEYLSVCRKTMLDDVVKSLAGPLLLRMCHTKDGAKVAVACVKLGTAKERKSIVKGLKGHVSKIAQDEHSSTVLMAIFDVVDDTKLVSKIVVSELIKDLKDIILHKHGRRCILQLLAPGAPRYFPADVLLAVQAFNVEQTQSAAPRTASNNNGDAISEIPGTVLPQEKHSNGDVQVDRAGDAEEVHEEDKAGNEVRGISRKDPSVRRLELLSGGDFGKKLAAACSEQADQLLRSPTGTDVLYEVAMGGIDEVMWQVAPNEVLALHKAVAQLAATVKFPDAATGESEHVLEQYHASRTIRRLILNSEPPSKERSNSPSFAATLWDSSLKDKCKVLANGHSAKVISAYGNCKDEHARSISEKEIKRLVKAGVLKADSDKP